MNVPVGQRFHVVLAGTGTVLTFGTFGTFETFGTLVAFSQVLFAPAAFAFAAAAAATFAADVVSPNSFVGAAFAGGSSTVFASSFRCGQLLSSFHTLVHGFDGLFKSKIFIVHHCIDHRRRPVQRSVQRRLIHGSVHGSVRGSVGAGNAVRGSSAWSGCSWHCALSGCSWHCALSGIDGLV